MGLAVGVNAPYLGAGYQADDLLLINLMRQDPLPWPRWRGPWSVWDIPAFTNLWWRDADAIGAFWRPLPGLVFEGAVRLFGEQQAFPLHLLALLLHGAVAGGLYLLLHHLGRPRLGLLAALFFVLCEDHSMGVGWVATITDMMAVALLMAALLLQAAWLRERRPGQIVGALLAAALALTCKESAVVGPLLLALLAACFPRGRAEDRPGRPPLLAWAPGLALTAGFLLLYRALQLGGMRNLMYLDPLGQPGAWLLHLALHGPVMLLATITPVPPSLPMFMPASLIPLAVAGGLVGLLWLALLRPWWSTGLARFGAGLWLIALLPQMGADASERGLYLPFVGAAILLALPVEQALASWRQGPPLRARLGPLRARLGPQRARLGTAWALTGVLLPGALLSLYMPGEYIRSFDKGRQVALSALPAIQAARPAHVLVLGTSGMMDTFYVGGILEHARGAPLDLRILSSANVVLEVERLPGDAFLLRADRPGWLSQMFARVVRTQPTFSAGRRYQTDLFTATLQDLTPAADDVLTVRFDLTLPIDDPRLLILSWDGAALSPVDLAGMEAGERRVLADTSDVWASMM